MRVVIQLWGRALTFSTSLNFYAVNVRETAVAHMHNAQHPYVHRYCACAARRANVAGRIGNRVSPAESAFSACIGSGSSQT